MDVMKNEFYWFTVQFFTYQVLILTKIHQVDVVFLLLRTYSSEFPTGG